MTGAEKLLAMVEQFVPRESEVYGNMRLSVQASAFAYCIPRVSGLPFDDYTHYEVAIIDSRDEFVRPTHLAVNVPEAEPFWDRQVGAFVPKDIVEKIRINLAKVIDVESNEVRELPSSE